MDKTDKIKVFCIASSGAIIFVLAIMSYIIVVINPYYGMIHDIHDVYDELRVEFHNIVENVNDAESVQIHVETCQEIIKKLRKTVQEDPNISVAKLDTLSDDLSVYVSELNQSVARLNQKPDCFQHALLTLYEFEIGVSNYLVDYRQNRVIIVLILLALCGILNTVLFFLFLLVKRDYDTSINDKMINIDRLEMINSISGSAAHEFRNVLSVISGYTEVMTMNVKKDDNIERLQTIQQMCARGLDLVKQLKRPNPEEPQTSVCISDVLHDAVTVVKIINKNLEIDCWFNLSTQSASLNIQYLDQIILNVLLNASQAVAVNGGHVFAEYFESEKEHIICVHDTGIGIEDKNLDNIFDLFYSTKGENGSGIGLAVTLNLVKQLKGTINVENKDWTTFTIHIPK